MHMAGEHTSLCNLNIISRISVTLDGEDQHKSLMNTTQHAWTYKGEEGGYANGGWKFTGMTLANAPNASY